MTKGEIIIVGSVVVIGLLSVVGLYKLSCKSEIVAYLINSRCYEYSVIREGSNDNSNK